MYTKFLTSLISNCINCVHLAAAVDLAYLVSYFYGMMFGLKLQGFPTATKTRSVFNTLQCHQTSEQLRKDYDEKVMQWKNEN